MTSDHRDGPPRTLIIAALLVAVAALVVVLGIAAVRQGTPEPEPVAIAAVPAPKADGPDCRALLAAVPELLGDFRRAATAEPTPAGAAAWQAGPDTEAIILRCGLDRPVDFVVGAPLQVVDDVQWFRVDEEAAPGSRPEPEQPRSTWYAVDRPVYVALTLPQQSGPTPIQVISRVLADTLPARPLDPGPPR